MEGHEASKSFRLELERTRRELDDCRDRLAKVDEQLQVYKEAEALLHGQKHLAEMIARGDSLEAILQESCQVVEKSLPGSLAIILLLDGNRLRRGAAPSLPEYIAEVDGFGIDPDAALAQQLPLVAFQ